MEFNLPSPIQQLDSALFIQKKVEVFIKRDDLIHPEVAGNKWRKLKLNLEKCKQGGYQALLTFGGAYSNHVSATAAAGKILGIKTIGIIRGDELTVNANKTLLKAHEDGMELIFVSREEYGWRYETHYKHVLRNKFGNVLVVEEGGANYHGLIGASEIVSELQSIDPTHYILASGTGTTAAGILYASNETEVISVPVFKNGEFIADEIRNLLEYTGLTQDELQEKMRTLNLQTNYGFGGYGKFNSTLIKAINQWYSEFEIPFDQVYTGKMFYALMDLIKNDEFEEGSKIVAIHTGGIQGLNSIKDRLNFDI